MSTCRKVPTNEGCKVFPRSDPNRQKDGVFLLGPSTRNRLSEYTDHLYKETSFNTHFKDRSEFMIRMMQRDQQFRDIIAGHLPETPTCCRVLNHPDPCPHCWTGGLHHDDNPTTVEQSGNMTTHSECSPPQNCARPSTQQESACCHGSNVKHVNEGSVPNPESSGEDNGDTSLGMKEAEIYEQSDLFGPWSDSFKMCEEDEKLLLPHYYHFKLPSSVHCWPTQNDLASTFLERHDPVAYSNSQNIPNNFGPWTAMSRAKDSPNEVTRVANHAVERTPGDVHSSEVTSLMPLPMRNTYSFRDENNLRIPCISTVLGNSSKAAFHKRYHQEHPEPIPDLRDNMKSAKRVTFFGYNSYVYR